MNEAMTTLLAVDKLAELADDPPEWITDDSGLLGIISACRAYKEDCGVLWRPVRRAKESTTK